MMALAASQRALPQRCPRRDGAEATARAMLNAWVLQEDLATAVRTALREDRQGPVRSGLDVRHYSKALVTCNRLPVVYAELVPLPTR